MTSERRPETVGATTPTVASISQDDLRIETHQVIRPDGTADEEGIPNLTDAQFCDLYRWLVLQRTFDERATNLQRRGQLGTYASGRGQEASIIGSAYALDDRDWIFPYGQGAGALLMHGLSMRDLLLYWRGVEDASRMEGANVDEAVAAADAVPHRDVAEMFVHLYAELPPELSRQLDRYRDFLDAHPEMAEYIHQREKG